MADEFDPLKHIVIKPNESNSQEVPKESPHPDDLLRPTFEPILQAHQPYDTPTTVIRSETTTTTVNAPASDSVYSRLDFKSNASKTPVREAPVPSSSAIGQLVGGSPTAPETASEARGWQNEEEWDEDEQTGHYNQSYEIGPPPPYYTDEYGYHEETSRKRGFLAAMSRLVHRFSGLGSHRTNEEQQVGEYTADPTTATVEYEEEVPQLVSADSTGRELTEEELALNERYSNKLRTQIIRLEPSDNTKVVDVAVHRESYVLFVCDTGRNRIEMFDFNGRLLYFLHDAMLSRFQPTAIAVADDGTIIIASHFSHRLHMYAPTEGQSLPDVQSNVGNEGLEVGFYYQQFKLGSQGHDLHQFYHPAGITIDPSDGYLYVCDRGNSRITVLRPEGICERVIELILPGEEHHYSTPIQVACQNLGDQLICIIDNGDAICFVPKAADGPTEIEPFYIMDHNGLGLQGATGLALDDHDRIFIADTGHHRILICTADGFYISHFGSEGDQPGELRRPCGLDMTADGTLIVADFGNKRLQLFGSMREQATVEDDASQKAAVPDPKNDLLVDPDTTANI